MSIDISGRNGYRLVDQYKVSASYKVPSGKVYSISFNIKIFRDLDNRLIYTVRERYEENVLKDAKNILEELIEMVSYSPELFEDPVEHIMSFYDKIYIEGVKDNLFFKSIRTVVEYLIIKDIVGYSILTPLLADEYIEDIALSAPETSIKIWHRKYSDYGWLNTDIILNEENVNRIISRLAFRSGRGISILEPILEGVLPEKYRVSATWMDEVSPMGSSFTIRKFRSNPLKLEDLIDSGSITKEVAALLWYMAESKKFIFIIGPSGCGKTTLLNALLLKIPKNRRVITLEEVPEINLIGGSP